MNSKKKLSQSQPLSSQKVQRKSGVGLSTLLPSVSSGIPNSPQRRTTIQGNFKKTRNTHYSKSSIGEFPTILYSMRYRQNYWKTNLELDPSHKIGQFNPILVFQYWSNLTQIINDIIEKQLPYEEFDFSDVLDECNDELLEVILNSYLRRSLQSLILTNCTFISLTGFLGICSFDVLNRLDVSGCHLITDQLIETFTSSLPSLQHIHLSNCPQITDQAVYSIALNRHTHLLSFVCQNNVNITYVSMNDLIMKCEQLQKIDVQSCPKVTFIGIVVHIRDHRLQYIGRNLQSININHCRTLQYYSLCWMMTALPMLTEFSAEHVQQMDDNIFRSMIGACPMLIKINVNHCKRLTMDIFRFLGQLYKMQLQELRVAKMSTHDPYHNQQPQQHHYDKNASSPFYAHFHNFLRKCSDTLQILDLSENKFINDHCFTITLPTKDSPPPYLSKVLTQLNLSGTSITSFGVVSLIPNYPNLQALNLSGLKYINDAALQIIALYCKDLRVLSINGCVSLTDVGIISICHHCKKLLELNASYDSDPQGLMIGEQYTDEIFESILNAAKCLQRLTLTNQLAIKFDHVWLKSVFLHYFQNYSLQSLNLSGCMNISPNYLQKIFIRCIALNNILLPHNYLDNPNFTSKKFWYHTFAKTIYTRNFNQNDVEEQSVTIKKSLEITVDVRKGRIPPSKGKAVGSVMQNIKKNPFFHLLQHHPNMHIFQYRDQYIRRRLLEKFSIRIIQKGWYVYKIWKKFKKNILSRKIAKRVYLYYKQKQFEKEIRIFTENHAAKKIQFFIIKYLLQYNRAKKLLVRHYRKFKLRKRLQYYMLQLKYIVKIQARVRGMLVRLSERYILSQVYLKLPKFWKIVANYANDEYGKQLKAKKLPAPPGMLTLDPVLQRAITPGNKKVRRRSMIEVMKEEKEEERQLISYLKSYASPEKIQSLQNVPLNPSSIHDYEIDELKDNTQDMLSSIREKMQERIELGKKPFAIALPITIPQSFDSKPYVSLFDGRKLSYYGNNTSIFSEEFSRKTKSQNFDHVSEESLAYFSGKGGDNNQHHPHHAIMGIPKAHSKRTMTASSLKEPQLPIHIYNNHYFPLITPKKRENPLTTDVSLYNPMINNFEFSKNYHKVLYCQMCTNRLRMILCKTCSRGYCFFCAFQYHNSLIHRNHTMEFMEPRIVHVEEVSQSLLYHIDNASNMMYDLRYVVRYLRSKAEVAKITEEKRLLKEYEKKQEQMRIAILQAQQEYNEKQDSAMKITLLYRSFKAKRIVAEKRLQLRLEKLLKDNRSVLVSIIKFQVLFRRYQVRNWFYSKGFVFRGIPKYFKLISNSPNKKGTNNNIKDKQETHSKILVRVRKTNNKGKLFPFDELRSFITKSNHSHHNYERTRIIGAIEDRYSQILQLLNANINFWKDYHKTVIPKIAKYSKLRDDYYEKLTVKSQQFILANLSNSQQEKDRNDKILREMKLKVDCLQERIENLKNIIWWIQHHLRFCYRKLALLPLRLQDLLKQLIWIYVENLLLQRIRLHAEKRVTMMSEMVQSALQAKEKKKKEVKDKEEGTNKEKNKEKEDKLVKVEEKPSEETEKKEKEATAEGILKNKKNEKDKEGKDAYHDKDFMTMPKEWLMNQISNIIDQLIAIDVSQESILKEELTKLDIDYYEVISFDSLLEELINSLTANNQIIAERVPLEVKLIQLVYGSEEAIRTNESLLVLKNKQKQLVNGSIDAIKVALQGKYDEQEKKNVMLYSFPGDSPDLSIDDMKNIHCILLDTYDDRKSHIDITHFLKVYYLQPWITSDAVDDIRFEERMTAKELKLGKLTEELNGIIYRVQDSENKKKNLISQIKDAEGQIAVHKDPVQDESDFQKDKREKNLAKFMEDKDALELELKGVEATLNELAIIDVPLQRSIDKINSEISEIASQLKKRRSNREKSIKAFFDIEKAINEEISRDLLNFIPTIDDKKNHEVEKVEACQNAVEVNRGLEDKSSDVNNLIEWPPFILQQPNQLALQALLRDAKSRVHCSPSTLACITIEIQLLHIQTQKEIYEQFANNLKEEQAFLVNFQDLRQKYEKFLVLFLQDLQFTRKQRAIELDIIQRKVRLEDLREIRLKALQEIKINQLRQEEKERREREEAEKKKSSTLVALAKKTKQAIRGVNDAIREMRYAQETAMSEEEMKIAERIREKNKEGLGSRPEAIRALYMTVGPKEADFFQRQNDHLKSRGLPFFERMEKSLGNAVYLWYQMTYDSESFITDIKLSHKNPDSEHYVDILKLNHKKKDKYDIISHDEIDLQLYFRKSKGGPQGIRRIVVTFTEEEETRMIVDGLQRLEPNLGAFGLPEIVVWLELVSKKKKTAATNTDALITEVKKVRELLSEHPKDKNLQELLKRLNEKLEVAYKKEESNEVTNPLAVAIDLMSINEDDMEKWLRIFERVDVERRGKINLEEFYTWIEMTPTDFNTEVFVSVDAIDDLGFIEFGDFIRAIGTYCFFGKDEILKFIYVFIDRERKGYCFFSTFRQFIDKLHPYDKMRANRAIKGMQMVDDVKPETKLTFDDFRKIQEKYPALFLPAFLLQDNLRKKTLGVDWWFQKLSLYSQVRKKMLKEGHNTEEIIQVELDRFKADDERKERMAKREIEIKNEASEVRRVILKAKQFIDEVS